jgi:hypothetical protein
MAATTNIEIDTELLERLRARAPGKDDRELIEDLARISLGFDVIRESQRRNAVPDDRAMDEAVRTVHEIRRAS